MVCSERNKLQMNSQFVTIVEKTSSQSEVKESEVDGRTHVFEFLDDCWVENLIEDQ